MSELSGLAPVIAPLVEFYHAFSLHFWHTDQALLRFGGILLWVLLRFTLPEGSQSVLKQTITFFVFSLFGEFVAALQSAAGYEAAGNGFYEIAHLCMGVALIRFLGLYVFRVVLPFFGGNHPRILEDIIVIAIYVVWGLVCLRDLGLEVAQIFTTSAILTAVIGFAMQDTLGNILGGISIHLDHSLEIGDWVKVGDISGQVEDVRWRYTKIATRNGEKLVVPNSQLMKGMFTVLGVHSSGLHAWRRWIWFGVDYSVPPDRVISLVESELYDSSIANVASAPPPTCVFMEFAPGYARYALRYWLTNLLPDDLTDSQVRVHVLSALQRAGLRIAIPEENVRLVEEDEKHSELVRERENRRRLDCIANIEVFSDLSPAEMQILADSLAPAPFASGYTIMRQGDKPDWLYILISGEVEVWLEGGGERQLVATLGPGEVFGEMELMVGETRQATCIAKTDIATYRVGRPGLEQIITARPSIADNIALILSRRLAELESLRRHMNEDERARNRAAHHSSALKKIRALFGLDRTQN